MSEKKYSKEHEWVLRNDDITIVGITNYAQESLGDIVFVDLPEIGKNINAGDQVGIIESVKAASDLFSPVGGEIIEVNNDLKENPQLINSNPEDKGWFMKIKTNDSKDLDKLMNLDEYKKLIN